MIMKTLIFFTLAIALAQTCPIGSPGAAGDTPKPAKVTIEQQAQWLQARAELAESRLAVKNAEDRFNQIVKEIMAVCPAILSPAGRPECPAPKPAEVPAK